jgi:transposase-like protein
VQRFTPLLAEAARPSRRPVGDRWWIDETYVKVGGRWRYVHRAIDQHGQIIDVYVAAKRDRAAARAFFQRALATGEAAPSEVVTDRAPVYPNLIDDLAQRRGTTTSSTPTTGWKPTTAYSSDDSARCATCATTGPQT